MPVKGTTLTSLRPLMQGVNGMVVASHPSAAMAGLEVLKNGGNAIDAGVAVGLALNVVHVDDCSFLGVAPTIIYLADRKEVATIDGLGCLAQGRVGRILSEEPRRKDSGRRSLVADAGRRRFVADVPDQVRHHELRTGGERRHRPGRKRLSHVPATWPAGSRPPSTSTTPTRQRNSSDLGGSEQLTAGGERI